MLDPTQPAPKTYLTLDSGCIPENHRLRFGIQTLRIRLNQLIRRFPLSLTTYALARCVGSALLTIAAVAWRLRWNPG